MWLNLLHPRNRLYITPWLESGVLSFSFCPGSANQTASYNSRRGEGRETTEHPTVLEKSAMFGKCLLMDGKIAENKVVSPLSFQVVLSLLAAGSGGSTLRQLLKFFNTDSVDRLNHLASQISDVICADGDPAVGPRMRCANALWHNQPLTLKPSFKEILNSDYKTALNPVDFQTKALDVRQNINSWVENETNGLVKNLIREESLNNSVQLVFTNALYFKGAWDEDEDRFESFEDIENVEMASFMTAKRNEYGKDGCQFLNQTYKKQSQDKRQVKMHFVYPPVDTEHGRRYHVTETLMNVCGCMTPKFDNSSEVEASHVLRQLGVTSRFSKGELTEMLSSFGCRRLYVSNIFQKSFIEINEQGTQAATATAAIVMSGCPPRLPRLPRIKIRSKGYIPTLLHVGRLTGFGDILMARTELAIRMTLSPFPR